MNIKKKVVEAGLDLLTYKVLAFIASFFFTLVDNMCAKRVFRGNDVS